MALTSSKASTPRPIKDSTFLDDPSAYPEFAELISKLPALHNFRLGFHNHRTASLLLVIAVCMALSGVSRPPPSAHSAAWLEYLKSAVYVERLAEHFEGFRSALATMTAIAVVSLLVYPLQLVVNWKRSTIGVVWVAIPSAAVWGISVWAESRSTWGLASGIWVGLFAACTTLKTASFAMVCRPAPSQAPGKRVVAGNDDAKPEMTTCPLTFGEYMFFLFLSPSLVCDVRLMKASASRPSRPLRAASEFFHAALAFLAVHCVAGSVVVPAMRMLVVGLRPQWFARAVSEWAELDASGGGGWPSWAATSELLEGDSAPMVILVCFLLLLMPLSSGTYFLVFYAFWHCVCLGMAELWGFPDRNLYGCWWLALDDPREMLRMWSAPVHRWLSACVHRPILQAVASSAASKRNGKQTPPGDDEKGGRSERIGAAGVSGEGWAWSVLSTFFVSMVFHEAIASVAFRGTFVPFNTFLLSVTASLVIFWEATFPLRDSSSSLSSSASEVVAEKVSHGANDKPTTGSGIGAKMRVVRAPGERGIAAIFVLNMAVQSAVLISECVGWLWWRQVLKK